MRFGIIMTGLIAVSISAALAGAQATRQATTEPALRGITIGQQTTYFTSPVNSDGTIDYVAAINKAESNGVTPQNNAAVILLRISVPESFSPEDEQQRRKVLRELGGHDSQTVLLHAWRDDMPVTDATRFDDIRPRPWAEADAPEVAAWLKSNDSALAAAEEAAKLGRCWSPVAETKHGLISPAFSKEWNVWNPIRHALCCRSMLRLHSGDVIGSISDLQTMLRLGRLLNQSGFPMVVMIGNYFKSAACMASTALLTDSRPTDAQRQQWFHELATQGMNEYPPITIFQHERFSFLFQLQLLATDNSDHLIGFFAFETSRYHKQWLELLERKQPLPDWDRISKSVNTLYDDMTVDRSQLPPAQRDKELKAVDEHWNHFVALENLRPPELWARIMDALPDNEKGPPRAYPWPGESQAQFSDRFGAWLVYENASWRISTVPYIVENNERVEWTVSVGPALVAYRKDHQKYPDSLEALVPKYLAALPENRRGLPIKFERRSDGISVRHDAKTLDSQRATLLRYGEPFDPKDVILRLTGD